VNELIEFLHARFVEDERIALGVSEGPHKPETWVHKESKYGRFPRNWTVDNPRGSVVVDGLHKGDAVHIARHGPNRALDEVAAWRRIIELATATQTAAAAAEGTVLAGAAKVRLGAYENVLRQLAMPFAGHADYRQEWAP
jgi:hypothetical protein